MRTRIPAEPDLQELAVYAMHLASLRRHAIERSAEGMWLVMADGTTTLNRRARQIAGDMAGDVDFTLIGWRCWYPDGRGWPPDDWPVAECLRTGQPVRDLVMVVDGPLKPPYAVRVRETWPVRDGGRTVGCIAYVCEAPMPSIDNPPWEA